MNDPSTPPPSRPRPHSTYVGSRAHSSRKGTTAQLRQSATMQHDVAQSLNNQIRQSVDKSSAKHLQFNSFKPVRLSSPQEYLQLFHRVCGPDAVESTFKGFSVQNVCRYALKNHSLSTKRQIFREIIKRKLKCDLTDWDEQTKTINLRPQSGTKRVSSYQAQYVPCSALGDSVVFTSKEEVKRWMNLIAPEQKKVIPIWEIKNKHGTKEMRIYRQAAQKVFSDSRLLKCSLQDQAQQIEDYVSSHLALKQLYGRVQLRRARVLACKK